MILGTRDAPAMVLTRLGGNSVDVIGVLALRGDPIAVTLELAWKDNKRFVSCIPLGVYRCDRFMSKEHGETFVVVAVPDRDGVLFHAGNKAKNSLGCVLLGSALGPGSPDGGRSVLGSVLARDRFRRELKGVESFWFRVASMPDVPALIAQMTSGAGRVG